VESLVSTSMNTGLIGVFKGKKVFLTGHTGFKGAWMTFWLTQLGAEVFGYSLKAEQEPPLLDCLGLSGVLKSQTIGDIRDEELIQSELLSFQPDFVFHLAAQALVQRSYQQPVETYSTNVMGTISVLEAMRRLEKPCVGIFVTSDKCYDNDDTGKNFVETDPLGGHDPYSSSKACSEIVISSWRRSFFESQLPIAISSARAGNVIGGGDWSKDRIVPDAIRHLVAGEPIPVRNPSAVRPWQHVLEPIHGYFQLAKCLAEAQTPKEIFDFSSAWNFGPNESDDRSVEALVREILKNWPGTWRDHSSRQGRHEASLLRLDTRKACEKLGWTPVWNFSESVSKTVEWYRRATQPTPSLAELTSEQIRSFELAASSRSADGKTNTEG
jgi:CDP-glucose 4,6-dehydratase